MSTSELAAAIDALRLTGPAGETLDVPATARACAAGLDRAGLGPGDVVAVTTSDPLTSIPVMCGAWLAGLIVLPLSAHHGDDRKSQLVSRAGARLLVDEAYGGSACATTHAPSLLAGDAVPGDLGPEVARSIPAPGTLVETSGSSGVPKLALHALDAHLASARAATRAIGVGRDDDWLLSLPLWHVAGLAIVFRGLVTGLAVTIPARGEALATSVTRHTPRALSVVATQLDELLDEGDARAASRGARCILAGGGPVPASLRARVLDAGLPLWIAYGSTETASLIATSGDPAVIRPANAAGRAVAPHRVRIDGDGCIAVSSPALFLGYLEGGSLSGGAGPDGWYATNDRGTLDDQGTLYVTGRADLTFISGGENVDPLEIEAALVALPGVSEAVVVPAPDARFGQVPIAFIRTGTAIDPSALQEGLRGVLPRHAIPRRFAKLARTDGVKPSRHALTEDVARGTHEEPSG